MNAWSVLRKAFTQQHESSQIDLDTLFGGNVGWKIQLGSDVLQKTEAHWDSGHPGLK